MPYALFLILLAAVFCVSPTTALQVPNETYNAWNPGAQCIRKDDYAEMAPLCRSYIPQEYIYIDSLQPQRNQKLLERQSTITASNYCVLKQIQIYCAEAYRPCYNVTIPGFGETAIAGFVCEDFCDARTAACIPVYLALPGVTLAEAMYQLSCAEPYPFDFGYPNAQIFIGNGTNSIDRDYTTSVVVWNDTLTDSISYNVTLPCYNDNEGIFGGWPVLNCPTGTHSVNDFTCEFDCPEPLVSEANYKAAFLMVGIVGFFSFILTAFVVVSHIIDPKAKLSYPTILGFYFTSCVMCLSFAFCLGLMVGRNQLWCTDSHTPNRWGNGWCTVQGITYVYFTLASGLWWLCIGLSVLATVSFKYKPQNMVVYKFKRRVINQADIIHAIMHLICWGIPLVVVVITLASHKLGYGSSDFWCTIHSGEIVQLQTGYVAGVTVTGVSTAEKVDIWNLLLLTIPMLLISIAGTATLILVLIFAWIDSKKRWKFIITYWRLLAQMILYIWIYLFVFTHHIAFTAQRQDQYIEYGKYVTCLKTVLASPHPQECNIASTVVYPVWFIAAFNSAAQGVSVFLIYGTSRDVYASWSRLFRRIIGIRVDIKKISQTLLATKVLDTKTTSMVDEADSGAETPDCAEESEPESSSLEDVSKSVLTEEEEEVNAALDSETLSDSVPLESSDEDAFEMD